jgi:gluconate 5-dehydrogenase
MHVKDLFDLSGRVALVTGGSRGLGLEMATGLGEAGATVAITARRESWLSAAEQTLRASGIECLSLVCDVAAADQVEATVAATLHKSAASTSVSSCRNPSAAR